MKKVMRFERIVVEDQGGADFGPSHRGHRVSAVPDTAV
jgi:hypothetical protein